MCSCFLSLQASFNEYLPFGCKHFLELWNIILDAKLGKREGDDFRVDQLRSVFPVFEKRLPANQKFKVFRHFSNQLSWRRDMFEEIQKGFFETFLFKGRDLCSKLERDQPIKLLKNKIPNQPLRQTNQVPC